MSYDDFPADAPSFERDVLPVLRDPVPPGHGEHGYGELAEPACSCGSLVAHARLLPGGHRECVICGAVERGAGET